MEIKKLGMFMVLLFTMAFLNAPVYAATETVTTTLYLNVQSLISFEVVLLGEAAVTSAGGGTPTASDIEFNSTTGSDANMQAVVTGGGSTQTTGNPILTVDNVGTVDIALNITIDTNVPACWSVYYNDTWQTDYSGSTAVTATDIEIDGTFTPAEAAKDIYLGATTSGCTSGDATTRTFTVEGSD